MSSGLLANPLINWVSFHGQADFGYLLRVCSGMDLPENQDSFFLMCDLFFNKYFDVKEMKRDIMGAPGGLQKVCKELNIQRVGTIHSAGSDSLVTSQVFFLLRKRLQNSTPNKSEDEVENLFARVLYGLGDS